MTASSVLPAELWSCSMSDKTLEERIRTLAEQVACDSLTRSSIVGYLEALAVEVGRLERTNRKLSGRVLNKMARIEALEALLRVARCPNEKCQDGAIPHGPDPDGNWEAEQCQWCDERAALNPEDTK